MKKRIVIVDDRPWKMQGSVQRLKKKNIEFYRTIYYPNNTLDKTRQNELMEDYKRVTGIEVIQVNSQNEFIVRMDELYDVPDIIFLMNYDLKENMEQDDFFTRVNVQYALKKEQDEKKIWFYTSGANDIKRLLRETFPAHVISVPMYEEGLLYWDENQILQIMNDLI